MNAHAEDSFMKDNQQLFRDLWLETSRPEIPKIN